MFCTQCGSQLNEGAKFCSHCGAPVAKPAPAAPPVSNTPPATAPASQPVPPAGTDVKQVTPPPVSPAFQAYLNQLSQKLNQVPLYVPELNCYQFYCERFSAALAKMKQFLFLTEDQAMGYDQAKAYSKACLERALNIYQGLPRGFQVGVVSYNVICQTPANPDACRFVQQLPDKHIAAFEMPMVVDLSTKGMYYCTQTPFWGFAMWKGIRKTAEALLRG